MKRGVFCILIAALAAPAAAAAKADRQRPTTPTNLRVVATGPYSVTLTWNPSTDNSGSFHYVICCANVSSQTAPQTASTFTYTAGLEAGRSFTLRIVAVDAAGNYSGYSNSVTFTLPRDTVAPTTPVVSVTGVGPRHVSLAWSSTDNGPNLWYFVTMNGAVIRSADRATSAIVPLLANQTTYEFTVRAHDFGGNASPVSDPISATTTAANPDDVTAPTTPANFYGNNLDGCETELSWSESTDDLDPQWQIEYQIFVNDVYDHSLALRYARTIVYGTSTGANTFSIVAVDTAGNKSEAATTTVDLTCGP
jgi:hypothetical protein